MSTEAQELKNKAESGDATAQYLYAMALDQGSKGVPQDQKAAAHFYILAANQHHPDAQFAAAHRYFHGGYVDKDAKKGIHYLTLATNAGHAYAARTLGKYYQEGLHGVPKDPTLALKYYTIAADGGEDEVQLMLAKAYEHGDPKLAPEKDAKKSAHYYQLLAAQEYHVPTFKLGLFYEQGFGVKQDFKKAREFLERAANQKTEKAMLHLAQSYEKGTPLYPQDAKQAFHYYQLLAGTNKMYAHHLGRCYLFGIGVSIDKAKAWKHYLEHINNGWRIDPDAHHQVAYLYETGEYAPNGQNPDNYKNAKLAVHHYTIAANNQNMHLAAQYRLARCYELGIGVQKNIDEAVRRYCLAAEQYYAPALTSLGDCYKNSSGVIKDEKEALRLYTLAANLGDIQAHYRLGQCYEQGIGADFGKPDMEKAIYHYQSAADEGDIDSLIRLGHIFQHGVGVEKDEKEAARLYTLLANQGHPDAQYNLGVYYQQGIGVKKDVKEAARLYTLSANQGHSHAQFQLGVCYEKGIGVSSNIQTAIEWYRKAAANNLPEARTKLRLCYETGLIKVPQDEKAAFKFYQDAANKGDPIATFKLALCYYHGEGTPKDLPSAFELLEANPSFGNVAGKNCGARLEHSNAPVEQKQAVEYKAYHPSQNSSDASYLTYQAAADRGDAEAQYELALKYRYSTTPDSKANALKYMKLSVAQFYPSAIRQLAIWHEEGKLAPKDEKEAVRLYTLAANLGDIQAHYSLGQCYEQGIGVEPDSGKAIYHYDLVAEDNSSAIKALIRLGHIFQHGVGVEKDEKEAFKNFQIAAEKENNVKHAGGEACFKLAYCYEHGIGTEKNEKKALHYYQLSATNHDRNAQYRLGLCYELGELGLPKDAKKAFKQYELVANTSSHKEANFKLGCCYEHGQGTPINAAKAVEHYRWAAGEGYAAAQYHLGLCYENAVGIEEPDILMALPYYQLSANQKYAPAQNKLGECYQNGVCIAQDCKKAVYYYTLAAEQEHPAAEYNLGFCYEKGIGDIKPDLTQALRYYRSAADRGYPEALLALERLSKRTGEIPSYAGTFLFFSDPYRPVELYTFLGSPKKIQLTKEKPSIQQHIGSKDDYSKTPVFSSIYKNKDKHRGVFEFLPDGQVKKAGNLGSSSIQNEVETASSSTTTQAPLSR